MPRRVIVAMRRGEGKEQLGEPSRTMSIFKAILSLCRFDDDDEEDDDDVEDEYVYDDFVVSDDEGAAAVDGEKLEATGLSSDESDNDFFPGVRKRYRKF